MISEAFESAAAVLRLAAELQHIVPQDNEPAQIRFGLVAQHVLELAEVVQPSGFCVADWLVLGILGETANGHVGDEDE